jgi:hypothetical protein
LYDVQIEGATDQQNINFYPVYQGFSGPAYVNGVQVPFFTQRNQFYNTWPDIVQNLQNVGTGTGAQTTYNLTLPILSNSTPANPPINGLIRGHVNMAGIIATGLNVDPPLRNTVNPLIGLDPSIPVTSVDARVFITSQDATGANIVVTDSGQFLLSNINYGLLMVPGKAPFGDTALTVDVAHPQGTYSTTENTINYLTGEINVTFPTPPADGAAISVQVYYFQSGLPRGILFYDNTLTLRSPPSQQYLVELEAYLTPAAFLTQGNAVQFGYMAEYIARGAARKILSDTGDIEQFQFYEPLFKEQELLVWKRSQRQWTSTRTQTIYSQGMNTGQLGNNSMGGSSI